MLRKNFEKVKSLLKTGDIIEVAFAGGNRHKGTYIEGMNENTIDISFEGKSWRKNYVEILWSAIDEIYVDKEKKIYKD